jgi:hypothetical protein
MRRIIRFRPALLGLLLAAPLLVPLSIARAASTSADPSCPPMPDPGSFTLRIDNPYMPLKPGTTYVFHGTSEGHAQVDTVRVTSDTKAIAGVTTRVVHDVVSQGGQALEDTLDFYAQDSNGDVWYFGENSTELPSGSKGGSWLAGVHGARAGIIMEANPHVGDVYRQECAPGVAADTARVLSLNASVTVPFGSFDHVLKTSEFSPLEPGVVEQKLYARGVGEVKEVGVRGETDVFELVEVRTQ